MQNLNQETNYLIYYIIYHNPLKISFLYLILINLFFISSKNHLFII